MPKLNIDAEAKHIFKPIEFTLDGVDYTVTIIESEVLEALIDSAGSPSAMRKAFAALVGAAPDEFKKTDTRKITLAMRHVTQETTTAIEGLDSKNVPKGNAAKTA